MKSLALCAVLAAALAGGTFTTAGAHQAPTRYAGTLYVALPDGHGDLAHFVHRRLMIAQTGSSTDTPTVTPTAGTPTTTTPTPTPSPTPTTQYPDPQTLLQQAVTTLAAINSVHFAEVAKQQGPVNFTIKAAGDATCTPAIEAKVQASRSIPGTAQHAKHAFTFIQFKNSSFWKYKKTHNKWQPVKSATASNYGFGFLPQFPLICPNLPAGGSGSGTVVAKDLTNVGPGKVNGVAVWHLHETLVEDDGQGNITEYPEDFYIGQTNPLLYRDVTSFTDTSQSVTGSLTTTRAKFGEHVKIKKPKKGSTKP